MIKKIELTKQHRGGGKSTSFSGRDEGIEVRKELRIADKDRDDDQYTIILPCDTTSFNPSFYLGLLFDSLEHLGYDDFKSKYRFDLQNMTESKRAAIEKNLVSCLQQAYNEYISSTGLD